MKRFGSLAFVFLIITLFLCSPGAADGAKAGEYKISYDNGGIYYSVLSGKTVTVKNIKTSDCEKYSFDSEVTAFCVAGGRLCALCPSAQAGVFTVCTGENGKIVSELVIINKLIGGNSEICLDSSWNIYILNQKRAVDIYDKNGKKLGSTDNAYFCMTQVNSVVFAGNESGIFRLTPDSEDKLCDRAVAGRLCPASENLICDEGGAVYNIHNGSNILSVDNSGMYRFAASASYILSLDGSKLSAYNRQNGSFEKSCTLSYAPAAVCADGDSVYLIKNEAGSADLCFEKKLFPEKPESTADTEKGGKTSSAGKSKSNAKSNSKSSPKSTSKTKSADSAASSALSFGRLKVRGSYIFLPPQMTRKDFRAAISYEGYSLSFNKSRSLGTNTLATFTKNGESSVYTIIVPGDLDGSGAIDTDDVDIMFNCLFSLDKLRGAYKTAADMNGDGRLSNADLVMLDRKIN